MVEKIIHQEARNFNSVSVSVEKENTASEGRRHIPRPLRAAAMRVRAAFSLMSEALTRQRKAMRLAALRARAAAGNAGRRESIPRAACMAVLFAAVAVVVTSSFIGVGLEVYVDGEPVGYVSDREQFNEVIESVEAKASAILGYPYFLNTDVTYHLDLFAKESDSIDTASVERALFSDIDEITQTYVMSVDYKVIGANDDGEALEAMAAEILAAAEADAVGADTVELLKNVDITLQYTASSNLKSLEEISDIIHSNAVETMTYTVQEGDVWSDIAASHGMSAETLAAMNPGLDPSDIYEGEELIVAEAVPLMSIRTTEIVQEEVAIEHGVEYVSSSAYWKGDSFVTQRGSDGMKLVTSEIVSVDGKVREKNVLEEEILQEPTTEIITLGTRNFILPFPGYKQISSTFGWRTLRGRANNHKGIDFAGAYGSTVRASYSGTVVLAGWYGGYGKAVIIDHGSGYQTVYGHNSSLAVKVGDYVTQGQTIAYVGSTGNSTGPHCHFEVRVNGTAVNPWKYLFG